MFIIKEVDYTNGLLNPDKKTIDFIYHGTNYPSAFYVAKNNKLKAFFTKHISFSTNYRWYAKKPALVGELFILFKLDFKKMNNDGIKFITNVSKMKNVENYEIISRQNEIKSIKKYIMETILLRTELKRFYLKFIEKIKDFETHPKYWADGTDNISIAKAFLKIDTIPKDYSDYEKIVFKYFNSKFPNCKIVDKI